VKTLLGGDEAPLESAIRKQRSDVGVARKRSSGARVADAVAIVVAIATRSSSRKNLRLSPWPACDRSIAVLRST